MIEWAVAAAPIEGEARSGDLHVVKEFPGGTLIGVIDGLGHGPEAAAAAADAAAALEAHPHEDVLSLMRRCHEQLRGARGAAITLISIGVDRSMRSLGVGNVEAVRIRHDGSGATSRESVIQRGGVVGFSLPPLRAGVSPLFPGDTLILATDGIRRGFADGIEQRDPVQHVADRILAHFRQTSDDALVLVARIRDVGL